MTAFIWGPRGLVMVASFAIVALVVAFADMRSAGPAQAAFAGDPYSVPIVVDTNPDPDIIETTITAQPAAVDVGGGVLASVLTFNGTIPGPEFRLKVGDTVIVHFQNNIAHNTGIHWHGIELNNASDGTPLTQNQVAPGDTFLYKFKVSRPGIYWYHPHHHSSTNQVFKGMYGSIIVTDPNEAPLVSMGTIPGAAQTRTLVLTDVTVCKTPGSNDLATYNSSLPHVSGGPLPAQPAPTPVDLCESAPLDEDGNPRPAFAAGDVPNIQKPGVDGRVNEGQTVLTNGLNVGGRAGSPSAPGALDPSALMLDVQAGQGLRLQLVNAATTRFFRLRLTDSAGGLVPLVRIGGQGGLLDIAFVEGGIVSGFDFKYSTGEILIDPGDRADVVAAIPVAATGVLTLWTEDFSRTGAGFSNIPTVPVAHFNVTGSAASVFTIAAGTPLRAATGNLVEVLGPATAVLLDPTAFAPPKPGLATQNVQLSQIPLPVGGLAINGIAGAHDTPGDYTVAPHPGSSRYAVAIGDTLELTVQNVTGAHHPFHLHGFSIQPIDLTRPANPTYTFPYREFKDNIDVPAQYTLRFRVRLDDRPLMDGTTLGGGLGRWVFHCHIFFHAVFGMISEFNVVAANGNERPNINSDDTLLQGNASTAFTMHGTYFDRDGDPVTLSASSGTILDAGSGQWNWNRTGGASGLVYVTATDSGGRQDQVAFQVAVNQPPNVTASPATGNEGTPIAIHGTAVDPESNPVTTMWTYTKGVAVDPSASCTFGDAAALDTTITCTHDGAYTITLTASDGINAPASVNASLTVLSTCCILTVVNNGLGTVTSSPAGIACGATCSTSFATGTPLTLTASAAAGAQFGGWSGAGCSGTAACSFTINADVTVTAQFTLIISPPTLPSGTAGVFYSQTFSSPAADPPLVFSAVGALPAGLTLSAAGVLSGTPTQTGTFNFAVNLTDGDGHIGTRNYSLDIACSTITLAPATLPTGTVGRSFSQTLTATGAVGTPVFSIAAGALPAGLSLSSAGVLSGTPTALGRSTFTVAVTDGGACGGQQTYALDVNPAHTIMTGAGGGGTPEVRTFDVNGASAPGAIGSFLAFDATYGGGVRVAVGDVTGDGVADVVAAPGIGGSLVRVVNGANGLLDREFFAYPTGPLDGVYVATGDVNGDGVADIITGAGGGAPIVRVFDAITGAIVREFLADASPVTTGVRVAAGDVNGDGFADIITSAGPGFAPLVRVFGSDGVFIRSFLAYDSAFAGGVFVAAGDVNGDGFADIVTGAGPGGGPHVRVWEGQSGAELLGFFAYPSGFLGGVRVAAGDVNGDGKADIITGPGPGGGPHVRVWDGSTAAEIGGFFSYPPSFAGGVFVASPPAQNRMNVDTPSQGATVSNPFTIAGWALADAGSIDSSGVSAIHVWAYPFAGGFPLFVGATTPGDPRPDVAAAFGGQFATSGFHLDAAGLPPGAYNLVVYVFSARTGTVTDRRVVRVIVQ